MSNITIIDSPMGAGKTTWAIENILKPNPLDNHIYITPFLTEIDRIISATKDHKRFRSPENKGEGKLASINNLLLNEDDIAATHELFKHLDSKSHEYIQRSHYTLILDEVLDVISPYNLKTGDLQLLLDGHWISIDDDGFIIWNSEVPDWDSTFEEVKLLAENHSLVCVNETILLWRYPPEIFTMFDEIYILTYLFESSILCAYFQYNEINYNKKSVIKNNNGNYELTDYKPFNASIFEPLINIYDGPLNLNIQQKKTGLSKQWFLSSENKNDIKQLKNNIYNYIHNVVKAPGGSIMWTCFKDDIGKLKGKGYANSHVSCNCRSTNDYANRSNLVYAINRYLNPGIITYFTKRDIHIDQDLYALSEMLQWIWRSQIRNGKVINIYIPANRMRWLLIQWLHGVTTS